MRRALITGGAGFIGSNVADRLVAEGTEVVVYDNFSTGRREFVEQFKGNAAANVVEGDVLDLELLRTAMRGCDVVFHFQANADVRHGLDRPRRDLEQNTVATANVLEAMRSNDVGRIVFSSTGSVYGEPEVFPTPEDCPFPVQTSLYAASKLAGEGMIAAHCHGLGIGAVVLRFVSILGERYTHGHVIDFYRSLRRDPTRLRVLGDGRQEKSYLYIDDCVDGILTGLGAVTDGHCEIFNLGTDATLIVDESIARICARLGVEPEIEHAGGVRGWPGDSPLIRLECSRIRALGWEPKVTIEEAVDRTLAWFEAHPDIVLDDAAHWPEVAR